MNPVLVVGVGRCGSSALANILRHLGVFMGEQFGKPDAHNPRGYWEDLEFKHLHQAFLGSDVSVTEFCHSVMGLAEKRKQYERWGFKDPRTAQMLPLYRRLLFPEAQYLWCQRDARDIQWSMFRGFPDANGGNQPWMAHYTWWIRHNMLEQWLPASDKACMRIAFDDLMQRPGWIIGHVCAFLGITATFAQVEEAIKTIQPRQETPDGLGAPMLTKD